MSTELNESIEIVKKPWIDSPYYDDAEKWTFIFWNDNSNFKKCFDRLDLRYCAELACGHGRHSEQLLQRYADQVQSLYCLDVIENNLEFSANRLSIYKNVELLLISGSDFHPLERDSLTSIFCYDAMVHFSPDIVESYLIDAARVLAPGGRALFHHSNLHAPETGTEGRHYGGNPHARNHMTIDLFAAYASRAGLRILETKAIPWSVVPDLDWITLLERP